MSTPPKQPLPYYIPAKPHPIQAQINDLRRGSQVCRYVAYCIAIFVALYCAYVTQTTHKDMMQLGMMICLPIVVVGYLIGLALSSRAATLEALVLAKPSVPPRPPGAEVSYVIARGGIELGELPITTIRQMLQANSLVCDDYYLDRTSNSWQPIRQLPL